VHKKTGGGHALFVIEMLNMLLRNNDIYWSNNMEGGNNNWWRYVWDQDTIDFMPTGK